MNRVEEFIFKKNRADHIKLLKYNLKYEYIEACKDRGVTYIAPAISPDKVRKILDKLAKLINAQEFEEYMNVVIRETRDELWYRSY